MQLKLLLSALLVVTTSAAIAGDEFQTATILDARAFTKLVGKGNSGIKNENANEVTVLLGDMKITAEYRTWFRSGEKSAGNLVVGSNVPAEVTGKRLLLELSDGKVIKARIVRRETATR